ncbi:MAG TPA: ABC transporter permease [Candidatus Cryosericum sp.]|nr:ABC transporter permease [Candidatus Cryosericum sp.]
MTGYLLRRGLMMAPLLLGAASVVFLLIHLIPGDPAQAMLGPGALPADIQALQARLGLDRPLGIQFLAFLGALLRGDLGVSIHYQDPVGSLLLERLPATAMLATATLAMALLLAVPAGVMAALRPSGAADRATAVLAAVALSLPSIWLGPLLVILFSIRLNWLPVSGADRPASIILPAATLAFSTGALLARLLRTSLAEELGSLYVRSARARGLSRLAAALRHALRNACGPVVTTVALQVGSLLTGAILTETIFAWPGLGRLLVRAISYRDYPLVQGCVLLFAALYIGTQLLCDAVRGALDPRVAA